MFGRFLIENRFTRIYLIIGFFFLENKFKMFKKKKFRIFLK